ncbi:Dbl homology domain-containing protein [Pluteus cervinus]|uniref:Dbl homology domain-containing protein n=1 Tax=Pluteus cervinus TaxID=181527 RepID=A0ACD3ABR2_9AGAR|nr:Dbl homology domain-containing protein [Pluteus cervinus]
MKTTKQDVDGKGGVSHQAQQSGTSTSPFPRYSFQLTSRPWTPFHDFRPSKRVSAPLPTLPSVIVSDTSSSSSSTSVFGSPKSSGHGLPESSGSLDGDASPMVATGLCTSPVNSPVIANEESRGWFHPDHPVVRLPPDPLLATSAPKQTRHRLQSDVLPKRARSASGHSCRSGTSFGGQHATSKASARASRDGSPPWLIPPATMFLQMSQDNLSTRTFATRWSEVTEEDLIANIDRREQTRQEFLFEIVASEERYVGDLIKLKEAFIDPLLHPFTDRDHTSVYGCSTPESLVESSGSCHHLPIASQFISPDRETLKSPSPKPSPRSRSPSFPEIDDEDPPYTRTVPHPLRSNPSLLRLPRLRSVSSPSLGQALPKETHPVLSAFSRTGITPYRLPEELRTCLEVIEEDLLRGHLAFLDALRLRLDQEYPLVRSLASIFATHKYVFLRYTKYVLQLMLALDQVGDALNNRNIPKRKKRNSSDWDNVCTAISQLEQDAAERGETGLATALVKPLHRLLKYPRLLQGLLANTDPSTFEYTSTHEVLVEMQDLIKGIEDEMIQQGRRDRTREVLTRIEGLDRVPLLAHPPPSRVFVEETIYARQPATQADGAEPVPKFGRRIRLPPWVVNSLKPSLSSRFGGNRDRAGGQNDLWTITFNDVVLVCQRTGVAPSPSSASKHGKKKKHSYAQSKNLYKFVKVERWQKEVDSRDQQLHHGVPSASAKKRVALTRRPSQRVRRVETTIIEDNDSGAESDHSDRGSAKSLSYWGAIRAS